MPERDQRAKNEILDQLRELGRNLEQVIRTLWESEQGQEIREQFSSGLKELNAQIDRTVDTIRANPDAQDLGARVKNGWESAGGDEAAENLRRGIRDALKALNEQMNDLVETIPSGSASREQGDAPEGDVE